MAKKCFCGSGLPQLKCHPSVHNHSLAGKILKLHHQADLLIENHRTDAALCPCRPGCSECCTQLFWVPQSEFMIIAQELRRWPEEELDVLRERVGTQWELIGRDHPDFVSALERSDDLNFEDFEMPDIYGYPCLLLHPETGACRVYQARTLICRCFGSSVTSPNNVTACSVIGLSGNITWGPDTTELFDRLLEITYPIIDGKVTIDWQYPIVYWLWLMFQSSKPGEVFLPNEDLYFKKPYADWVQASRKKSLPD